MTFGQRLYHFRKAMGMSQQKLATASGVSRPTITLIETGKQASVTIDVGKKLAKALGVKFATLVGPEGQEDSETVPVDAAPVGA